MEIKIKLKGNNMKNWQFEFICGNLAYIQSRICTVELGSILFALASILFYLALVIDIIKTLKDKQ